MNIAFMFPGQGSQAVGMGRELYEDSSVVRELYEQANEALGLDIATLCFQGPGEALTLTTNAQPALLLTSYAAFRALNRVPTVAAGHSLGEYSALVAAGCLGVREALRLVRARGQFMQEAVPVGEGAMAALIAADLPAVEQYVRAQQASGRVIEVANYNSPQQVVLSGRRADIDQAVTDLGNYKARLLAVSAPFHCSLMEPAERRLAIEIDALSFSDCRFPVYTNVDAQRVTSGERAAQALKRQVSRPVRWTETIRRMIHEDGITHFVEIGPGTVLTGLVRRILRGENAEASIMNVSDSATLVKTLDALGAG